MVADYEDATNFGLTRRTVDMPPKRLANLSRRPAVSMNFCSPVKNGWQAAQIPTEMLETVERV